MNKLELSNVSILKDIVEYNGVIGIKTSFEDEGASFNEVLRLKELCNQAGTKLLLKISGAEAKRDLADSTVIGVKGIVAPMIESPFALEKYIDSAESILGKELISNIQLGINIETINAYKNFDKIVESKAFEKLYHVTLGRVDFVKSMNKDRTFCNSDDMFEIANEVFSKSRQKSKKVYLGGAISIDSKDFLNKLFTKGLLDKFETRYVIYDPAVALKDLDKSLIGGQKLELGILNNRKNTYYYETQKEINRIEMIEKRVNSQI